MRRVRLTGASVSMTLDAPLRSLQLDTQAPDPQRDDRSVAARRPGAAQRIREALQVWLEEDM